MIRRSDAWSRAEIGRRSAKNQRHDPIRILLQRQVVSGFGATASESCRELPTTATISTETVPLMIDEEMLA